LSVSQANRVLEYELQYQVEYVLQQGGISQLPVMVTMTRDFVNDEENVLGTSAQASVVREELERDIVQALLRKINAQLRYLAVGETSSK
jgi:LPS-assembly lipoprotein